MPGVGTEAETTDKNHLQYIPGSLVLVLVNDNMPKIA